MSSFGKCSFHFRRFLHCAISKTIRSTALRVHFISGSRRLLLMPGEFHIAVFIYNLSMQANVAWTNNYTYIAIPIHTVALATRGRSFTSSWRRLKTRCRFFRNSWRQLPVGWDSGALYSYSSSSSSSVRLNTWECFYVRDNDEHAVHSRPTVHYVDLVLASNWSLIVVFVHM